MFAWQSIAETVQYIEAHLSQRLSVEELADVAHLSKFYFQRLFFRLVGKSPMEYIRLRRMASALKPLREQGRTILEVAVACGYQSHSSFTTAFKETYGIAPQVYRNTSVVLDTFLMPELSLGYALAEEGVPLVAEGMVLEIERKELSQGVWFVGHSRHAEVAGLGQPKVNLLAPMWDDLPTLPGEDVVGVDILTPCEDPAYFEYFVGVEVSSPPAGAQLKEMPAGQYVVCRYEAEDFEALVGQALYKASGYLYDTWLPHQGLLPEPVLVQKYFRPFTPNCYIELWAKVKNEK